MSPSGDINKTFEKGYRPRWTEEVFAVSAVQYTDPPTYKIADLNNEEIQGTFYGEQLQKTSQEIFRIEKVIKRKGNRSLVKRVGYPDSFNSWNTRIFIIFARKIIKIPKFFMIFAGKNARIFHKNCRKNNFPDFF